MKKKQFAFLGIALLLTFAWIAAPFFVERSGLDSKANIPNFATVPWDGTIAPSYSAGNGTAAQPYLIVNAPQFARVAYRVNNGYDTTAHFRLSFHMGLNDGRKHWSTWQFQDAKQMWTPIGTIAHPFNGTFDGAGRYVGGIFINRPYSNYQGLFGVIGPQGKVHDVSICESYIYAKSYVGSIAGLVQSGGIVTDVSNVGIIVRGSGGTPGTAGIRNPSAVLGAVTPAVDVRNGGTGETTYVGGIVGYGNARSAINRGDIYGSPGGRGGDGWSASSTDYGMSGGHGGKGGKSYTGGITGYGNVSGNIPLGDMLGDVYGAPGGDGGRGGNGGPARVKNTGVITSPPQVGNQQPTNPGVVTTPSPVLPYAFPSALGSEYTESYEPLQINSLVKDSATKDTDPAGHGGNGGDGDNSYTGGWTGYGNVISEWPSVSNEHDPMANIDRGRNNQTVIGAPGGSGGRGGNGGAGLTAILPYSDKVTISGIELDLYSLIIGDTHDGGTHHAIQEIFPNNTHTCTSAEGFGTHCHHHSCSSPGCGTDYDDCGTEEDPCSGHPYCDNSCTNCTYDTCYHYQTNSYTAPKKVWVTERFDITRWLPIVEDSGHGGKGGKGFDSFTAGLTATGYAENVVNNGEIIGALGGRGGFGGDGGTPVPPRSILSMGADVRTVNRQYAISQSMTKIFDCNSDGCWHPCCGASCYGYVQYTCTISGTRYYRGNVVARAAFSYDVSARGGNGGIGGPGGDSYVNGVTASGEGFYTNSYCNVSIAIPRIPPPVFDPVRGVMRPSHGGWGGEGGISDPPSYNGIGGTDGANGKESPECMVPAGYPNPPPPPPSEKENTPGVLTPDPETPIHLPEDNPRDTNSGRSGGGAFGWVPLPESQMGVILMLTALGGLVVLFGVLFGGGLKKGQG